MDETAKRRGNFASAPQIPCTTHGRLAVPRCHVARVPIITAIVFTARIRSAIHAQAPVTLVKAKSLAVRTKLAVSTPEAGFRFPRDLQGGPNP